MNHVHLVFQPLRQVPVRHLTRYSQYYARRLPPFPTMPKATESSLVAPEPPLATPALDSPSLNYSYAIARGEMGVLSFEPYKSLILPFWAFRTVPIAQRSASVLWTVFESYVKRGDLVGADMARKFIQMGMTRAKRYANHKGGRKYGKDGVELEKWGEKDKDRDEGDVDEDAKKRREKEEASAIFKAYWRRCTACEEYLKLKQEWTLAKKEWLKDQQDRESE